MSRLTLRIAAALLFIPAVKPVHAQLSREELDLAQSYIARYYRQQNLSGAGGALLENMLLVQDIRILGSGVERKSRVLLFANSPKVCLVYFVDDKGMSTAYLRRESDTWIYRESLRLPLKVSQSQSVFGEANLGDILGIDLSGDFTCESVELSEGQAILGFVRVPSSVYPYSAVDVTVDRSSGDFRQIEYKGVGGRVVRKAVLTDYRVIGGMHRVPTWTISNLHMETDRRTVITYRDIRPQKIPNSYFQPNANSLTQFMVWAKAVE